MNDEKSKGEPSAPTDPSVTAEIITDPTAIDCGCSGGCGRMPDEMVITDAAGCAPLCIHCYTRAVREDERRRATKAEPSAPTDGAELARLLPGLAGDMDIVREQVDPEDATLPLEAAVHRLARACELLLAERDHMADQNAALEHDIDEAHAALDGAGVPVGVLDERAESAAREIVTLHARVAELEVANANALRVVEELQAGAATCPDRRAAEAIETTLADEQSLRNALRANGHGPALDAGRSGVEVAIGLLSAPPPHTAAALLARVDEVVRVRQDIADARDGEHRENLIGYLLIETAKLTKARAALGAPSPLDGVVAEVCALPDDGGTIDDRVDEIAREVEMVDISEETDEGIAASRGFFVRCAVAGLRGMLACDAAKGGA